MTSSPRRLTSPRRWTPPAAPANQGRTAATRPFVVAKRLATGGHGPEDVVFDKEGALLTGLADGSVVRIDPATGARTVVGNTGGRPLGLEPSTDGSILICDHDRGLLRMSADGSVEVLVDTNTGTPLTFASNVVGPRRHHLVHRLVPPVGSRALPRRHHRAFLHRPARAPRPGRHRHRVAR